MHWIHTAWNTYILHTEHNNGYQFWSGPGSDISEILAPVLFIGAWYHHHNCTAHSCPWPGKFIHPEHGNKVCKRHLVEDHQLHPDGQHYNAGDHTA